MTQSLSYGSWPSSISSHLLTQQSVRLGEPQLTASGHYWIESRPQEKGRCVLMHQPLVNDQPAREVLPDHISVRSQAHEYGGASYLATAQALFYVDGSDQRVYRWDGQTAIALTPEGAFRYADFCLDAARQRLLCVREDHRQSGQEEKNELVAIDLTGRDPADPDTVTVLVSGHDFFSNPRLSPDGRQLSWMCWDHPHMPWDHSECWLSLLNPAGLPDQPRHVAGGPGESVFQPQWSPSGDLYVVSDRDNWWNLYRVETEGLSPISQLEAEFATPQWVFGMSTYGFLSDHRILACFSHQGQWQLALIDTADKGQSPTLRTLDTEYTEFSQIQCLGEHALFFAANAAQASQLFTLHSEDIEGAKIGSLTCLASSNPTPLAAAYISNPKAISFPTGRGQAQAHGFYYPPCNPDVTAPAEEKPPLMVLCHGGPTGATDTGLNLKIQYWTSRGFAVMDVNYRGSTGYGRHYREQLNGSWGLHDVEDVCAAADFLVQQGLADPERLTIKGSSAGGYTVLAALTFRDTFKAGASLYGIGNLETLATDTHKFEARYLDSLVGAYPEQKDEYVRRSPLFHADRLNCPVIFFQGLDDKVVPPNQAEAMVAALDHKQVPVAYVPFAGEGHGFRQASSIQRCLEAEWSFYSQVFGFTLPEEIEPVEVKHIRQYQKGGN